MKRCMFCGTDNENSALFCTVCGKKLVMPGSEHDFTSGVMRYVPEKQAEAQTAPVYLNASSYADVPAAGAIPKKPVQPANGVMQQGSRSGRATVIVIGVITFLILLIIIGIVLVLGGMV